MRDASDKNVQQEQKPRGEVVRITRDINERHGTLNMVAIKPFTKIISGPRCKCCQQK
jgi:hypothetical protein